MDYYYWSNNRVENRVERKQFDRLFYNIVFTIIILLARWRILFYTPGTPLGYYCTRIKFPRPPPSFRRATRHYIILLLLSKRNEMLPFTQAATAAAA